MKEKIDTYDLDTCKEMLGYIEVDIKNIRDNPLNIMQKMKAKSADQSEEEYKKSKLEYLEHVKQLHFNRIKKLKGN